jgi:hypothetical protein
MFELDLNLDAFGEAENFIDTYGTDKGRRLANQLGIKGKGSSLLATGLSNYAWNTYTAQKCRLGGKLDTALMYESIANRIYTEDIQPVCNCW